MPSLHDLLTVCVFLCSTLVPAVAVSGAEPSPVVRILSPRLADAFDAAVRVSPTLRAIVDELERSNLIVHVEGMTNEFRMPLSGAMRFVYAASGRRLLRISINDRLPDDRRAAALAHELYHAMEVAIARSVIDRSSFAELYKRIGYPSGDRLAAYETDGAKWAGAVVLSEIRAATSAARRAANISAGSQ
jgi:hypothetical protein